MFCANRTSEQEGARAVDNSILKKALGLEGAVVAGWEERPDGSVVVDARPRAATRCPVCGGRCGACVLSTAFEQNGHRKLSTSRTAGARRF